MDVYGGCTGTGECNGMLAGLWGALRVSANVCMSLCIGVYRPWPLCQNLC